MLCYCGSSKEFDMCCKPFLDGSLKPKTPQELMRSRYSAFATNNASYIMKTTAKENRYEEDLELIEEFAASVIWLKLDVVRAKDDFVEFKAYYRDLDGIKLQHEKSIFTQENGMWFYKNGELFNSKIERKEPCPCSSGKKYKKCCI
jgi:SEC-C motif-containing protein